MSGFDPQRLARIGSWMQSYVDARKYAGCSVLIAQDGAEVYYNDCGQRDMAGGLPFQRDTVARIYSMTKPITTVALMSYVERGVLHLDAPVSDFIPAFAGARCLVAGATDITQTEPCASPTLHQLLTHTAGLSYPFNPGVLPQQMHADDLYFRADQGPLAQMADKVAALPLAFPPGSRWEYSVSIDILGRVLEVVSGKTLDVVLRDLVFDPLGMDETRFGVSAKMQPRFASLYTPLAGNAFDLNAQTDGADSLRLTDDATKSPYLRADMFSGGGGLVGTIDDYLTFTEMLRTGGQGVLSPKTLDFMMRNHLGGDIASMGPSSFAEQPMHGMGFGLGGAVVLDPGRAGVPGTVGDFSWGGMASTFFWVDPVQNLSVVFFTQLSPSSSYPARAQLKALVHGALQ
jgi:CubicO group peptidase (beta-lactamase class C family)